MTSQDRVDNPLSAAVAAVASADEAFQEWSEMSGSERGRVLSKAASYLYEAHPELARLEVPSIVPAGCEVLRGL